VDQTFLAFPREARSILSRLAIFVLVVIADSVAVAEPRQEEVEQDLDGGEVGEKTACNQPMIDPTEGALDFSYPRGIQKSFEKHGHHLPG